MIDVERITGLVLAGGRGSRMGSVDKGLQAFRGEPLVAHALGRLAPQVGRMLISANRHHARYAAFGHRVVADLVADAGPLAGLHAGLSACDTDFLVAVPCDVPLLPLDLVERLGSAFDGPDVQLASALTAAGGHPVFCLMRTTVVDRLVAYLGRHGRSVHAWIAEMEGRAVSFDDESAFRNLNTFDELHDAERSG